MARGSAKPPEARFLYALWGKRPPGLIQVWQLHGRRSAWLGAPSDIEAWGGQPDVYVGVALADRSHGPWRRCPSDQTAALAGLWADIDITGGPERKADAAPDLAQAVALAQDMAEPTVLVDSGHGLHAWWCFERPWQFGGPADRLAAARMAAQWQHLLRARAREWGFGLDATHDLARLLRLPGTTNAKGGEERPVELLACAPRTRHPRAELAARCAEAGDLPVALDERPDPDTPVVDVASDGALSALDSTVVEALLENSPEFRRSWTHALQLPSMSEYDLSVASYGARAGLNDQQLADLIRLHRRTWDPADAKADRADYLRRTVARARRQSDREQHVDWFRRMRDQGQGRAAA